MMFWITASYINKNNKKKHNKKPREKKKNIIKILPENIIFSSILTKETKFPPVKKKVNDVRMRKKKSADDMYSLFFYFP